MSAYDRLSQRAMPVEVEAGASSYFTSPTETLDPSIFTPEEQIRPGVRSWALDTLYRFLRAHGFNDAAAWAVPWIAGSGASYQWSAARDPGDLDILIGVNYIDFRQTNPRYDNLSDDEIGTELNRALQATLWPATARQHIGTSVYEITWFVNPHATDIRSINPYAAYDILHARWTVRPIELPKDGPHSLFDASWYAAADADLARAKDITSRYDKALQAYGMAHNAASRRNALASLTQVTNEGSTLFDEIHLGRKNAFSSTGAGYADWSNFRWQAGKQRGTVQALHQIKTAQQEALKDAQEALYGAPLADANSELLQALGG